MDGVGEGGLGGVDGLHRAGHVVARPRGPALRGCEVASRSIRFALDGEGNALPDGSGMRVSSMSGRANGRQEGSTSRGHREETPPGMSFLERR